MYLRMQICLFTAILGFISLTYSARHQCGGLDKNKALVLVLLSCADSELSTLINQEGYQELCTQASPDVKLLFVSTNDPYSQIAWPKLSPAQADLFSGHSPLYELSVGGIKSSIEFLAAIAKEENDQLTEDIAVVSTIHTGTLLLNYKQQKQDIESIYITGCMEKGYLQDVMQSSTTYGTQAAQIVLYPNCENSPWGSKNIHELIRQIINTAKRNNQDEAFAEHVDDLPKQATTDVDNMKSKTEAAAQFVHTNQHNDGIYDSDEGEDHLELFQPLPIHSERLRPHLRPVRAKGIDDTKSHQPESATAVEKESAQPTPHDTEQVSEQKRL